MLRAFGAGLIACAMTGFGIWISAREKRRERAAQEAFGAVTLLKTSIAKQLLPLQEAIGRSSQQNPLLKVWNDSDSMDTEAIFRQHGLGREEIGILQTLIIAIPMAAAGCTEHFDIALEQLNQQLIVRKSAAEQAASLYPKLGLLGGAAVFLMLL